MIGDDIIVTVVAVKGGHTVQIGIDAPRHVKVLRKEFWTPTPKSSPPRATPCSIAVTVKPRKKVLLAPDAPLRETP
ncbi:hypothetical protein ABIC75_004585 [Dyella japonica]|uniref:Carbon storage regulator n=2 Tax=Dyella japonica TaxID=231455 RepID=A0ABV2K182_9GAMM